MRRLDVRRAVDRLIRREASILVALSAIALVAFLGTRALAAANRRTAHADAARWHDLGVSRLSAGDARGAVDAFRTASRFDREDRGHRFALADALRRTGDEAAALDVLMRLRSGYPEDVEVNTSLARLEASRGGVDDAVRYYQSAILALWQPADIGKRRALRAELIEFLLAKGASSRALSEALKYSGEIPEEAAAHVQAGRFLLRAGSAPRAEAQFVAALRLNPRDGDAIAGAGDAAFEAGDYERAREFLVRAPADPARQQRLALVDLILRNDPLLPHLTAGERIARLGRARAAIETRVGDCPGADALRQELSGMQESLATRRAASADSLGADLAHLARLARQASSTCAPEQPIDRAMLAIARRHGLGPE